MLLRSLRRGRFVLLSCLVATCLLAVAPAAQATFHEMSIREVYPGGSNNASYVELQMWAAGQEFVGGHHLVAYNPNGTVNEDFAFGGSVAHGDNQSTILVADSSYASVFTGKPAPDATDADLNLDPAGGAVCWVEGSPPDCVAWGNFTGPFPAHVPALQAGSPASPSGVTAGKALLRSIAAGCSTLLELGDDTNSSVADFSEQTPNPRNNATTPVESVCPSLPNTVIDTKPPLRTNSTTASFTFHAVPAAGASFECNLDEAGFESCLASSSYTNLTEGSHEFEVRAVNGAGPDPSPASYTWTVDLTPPDAIIDSQPPDESPGVSVSFTFHSTEVNSTFECKLDGAVKTCSASGATLKGLADGLHTFEVRATDQAGNQSTPGTFPHGIYTWTVDNSSVDVTPPNTFIDTRPPDPSSSATASFTYHADEAATFECKLDAGPFAACDPGGIGYTGLQSGSHTFQVRATDSSSNVDPTPAGYTFAVALPSSQPPVGGQGGAPAQTGAAAPQTSLRLKPASKTRDRTPTFRFSSSAPGSTFQCKVDTGAFKACSSPFTTKILRFGRHTIKIRAVLDGLEDPTPATFSFKVVRRK